MSLTLSQVSNNTATVEVQWGENTLNVVYSPIKVTEKTIQELQGLSKMNGENFVAGYTALNSVLIKLVRSWDFYEDDAQTETVPLTQDRLSELPMHLRVEIVKAVLGDIRPEALAPQEKTQN